MVDPLALIDAYPETQDNKKNGCEQSYYGGNIQRVS